jgi:DNA primase
MAKFRYQNLFFSGSLSYNRAPMDPISEIKSRINIEDLVSQYIPIKKAGRHFKALCPFHKERTPSFYISPERQLAYCFGCHKGGDHFKFVEEMEGLDFRGALKFLAEKAGVTLPKIAPQERQKKGERDRLIELHEVATAFFEHELWETTEGEKVLKYLKKRGLKEETIKTAQLGFSPGSPQDRLYTFLLEKNFTRDEILAGGLAFARDTEKGNCMDRFRTRLVFPIENLASQICAFGGRAMKEGDEPKYLNSPETPIYQKNSLLYNLSRARADIRSKGCALIVEGYMDALTCFQAGFKNAVACSGTALTENQLEILKRFTKEVILAFDRDTAGRLATERAIELAFEKELSVKVVVWKSEAKDPDECVRKDEKLFSEAIEHAAAATQYLIDEYRANFDLKEIEGKKKFIGALLPFVSRIKSPLELDLWLQQLSELLGSSTKTLYDEVKRFLGKQKSIPKVSMEETERRPEKKPFQTQEYLLGILLTHPEICSKVIQLIQPEDFEDIELQNIYRSLGTQYNQNPEGATLTLIPEELSRSHLISLYVETKLADMSFEAVEREVIETIRTLKRHRFAREKRSLVTKLGSASGVERGELIDAYQELLFQDEKYHGQKI